MASDELRDPSRDHPPRPIRIAILEDEPDFREFLAGIIAFDPGFELGFAVDLVAVALEALEQQRPDLILVDLHLPDGSGLEVIARAARLGQCKALALTMMADRSTVIAAFEAGASGYLLKDAPAERITAGIREAMVGHAPVSPQVAAHLLSLFQQATHSRTVEPTPREREILNMIARGLSYGEVAKALHLSVYTVGDHIKSIYRKLGVNSKSEAIFEARQEGWINRFD